MPTEKLRQINDSIWPNDANPVKNNLVDTVYTWLPDGIPPDKGWPIIVDTNGKGEAIKNAGSANAYLTTYLTGQIRSGAVVPQGVKLDGTVVKFGYIGAVTRGDWTVDSASMIAILKNLRDIEKLPIDLSSIILTGFSAAGSTDISFPMREQDADINVDGIITESIAGVEGDVYPDKSGGPLWDKVAKEGTIVRIWCGANDSLLSLNQSILADAKAHKVNAEITVTPGYSHNGWGDITKIGSTITFYWEGKQLPFWNTAANMTTSDPIVVPPPIEPTDPFTPTKTVISTIVTTTVLYSDLTSESSTVVK